MVHRLALWLLAAALAAHMLLTAFGGPVPVSDAVYLGVAAFASVVCLARGATYRPERLPWLALGAGLGLSAIGEFIGVFWLAQLDEPPYPSLADACYLASYPLQYVGILALLRARTDGVRPSRALDGVVTGAACAALFAAFVFPAILAATGGSARVVAVTLAYPVLDLALLTLVGLAFGAMGWRPDRSWALLGAALPAVAAADLLYAYQDASGTYQPGTLLDSGWVFWMTAIAFAAWQPAGGRAGALRAGVALPAVAALLALGLLLAAAVRPVAVPAVALAALAVLAAWVRAGLTYAENVRLLSASRSQALTDGLTDLPNRRALMADLDAVLEADRGGTLVFFDLDGFKAYNDAFGHGAGDALLKRFGKALLQAGGTHGSAYRLGGDEFCLLLREPAGPGHPAVRAAVAALSDRGEHFAIRPSRGLVVLGREARTTREALQLADQRMYADKRSHRGSTRHQVGDVLLSVLAARAPELSRHTIEVGELAAATGRGLGLVGDELDLVRRAGDLHDIGKVAIPDAIVDKAGPLDPGEWELMRTHAAIGERILNAAPALRPVARLVRSSHERWDGGGYPDGLAGEAIPLGARIVAVCDAYEAMTSARVYRAVVTPADALAELERCAGTQFDPSVVAAFADAVAAAAQAAAAAQRMVSSEKSYAEGRGNPAPRAA